MATVFVADRDDVARKTLAHHLRQRGHAVTEFSSGAELYAETVGTEPDLIVLETDLDDMDGFQVFARLRRKRPDAPFPVVFVTEFEHPRVARVLKQRGALGYVGKNRPPENLADAIQGFLPHEDPLYQRKLSAALAWLQSRGKTGRLDVEADGEQGYVMLHRGRVLEASWDQLRGDEAVAFLAESLPEATFHFAEGIDETDVGDELFTPAAAAPQEAAEPVGELDEAVPLVPPVVAAGAVRVVHDATTPVDERTPRPEDPTSSASVRGPGARAPRSTALDSPDPRSQAAHPRPLPSEPKGAVAAALALRGRRPARGGEGRRVLLGLAAGVVLLVLAGLAVAVFFPAYVPAGLAAILDDLGVAPAQREVEEAVPQLARTEGADGSGEEGDAAPSTDPAPSASDSDSAAAERLALLTRTDPTSPIVAQATQEEGAPTLRPPEETEASEAAPGSEPAEPQADGPAAEETPAETAPPPPPAPRRVAPRPAPRPAPPPPQRGEERAEIVEAPTPPPPAPRRSATAERSAPVSRPRADADGDGVTGDALARQPAGEGESTLVQRPVLLQRPQPYYPTELREEGVGGTVILRIRVGSNGRAQQVDVQRSSGHEALDGAAVAAVGTFLWEPARDVSGPTETWITQAVTFRP